ncbi:MAG: hypothetical protein AB7I34_07390 [Rhizobiaceae bacterium]
MAFAIDDDDEDNWIVYVVDFDAKTMESFSFVGSGNVQSAHWDPGRGLIWVLVDGTIFAIDRSKHEMFDISSPPKKFFVYSVLSTDSHIYVSGEYSNIWRISVPALEWEPLQTPEPKPPRAADAAEQTRRTKEYARKYPPYYYGFEVGEHFVFCGALGALARVHGTSVETQRIETEARLMTGRVEGRQISLSADSPRGEIYLGNFGEDFEIIFSDNQRSLHRTALHNGRRYIGIAEYPASELHNLYIYEKNELAPVETDCAREPLQLISLSSTGNALWAIDGFGIFRLSQDKWTLVDDDDLQSGIWPEGG